MGSLSIWHWVIIIAVALVLFGGKGKVSDLMGDVAKGIKSFKKGLAEEDADGKALETATEEAVNKTKEKVKSKA
jgi:sec-independent protein translocase protein TatA